MGCIYLCGLIATLGSDAALETAAPCCRARAVSHGRASVCRPGHTCKARCQSTSSLGGVRGGFFAEPYNRKNGSGGSEPVLRFPLSVPSRLRMCKPREQFTSTDPWFHPRMLDGRKRSTFAGVQSAVLTPALASHLSRFSTLKATPGAAREMCSSTHLGREVAPMPSAQSESDG